MVQQLDPKIFQMRVLKLLRLLDIGLDVVSVRYLSLIGESEDLEGPCPGVLGDLGGCKGRDVSSENDVIFYFLCVLVLFGCFFLKELGDSSQLLFLEKEGGLFIGKHCLVFSH